MFDQGLSRREKTKCSLDSGPTVHFVHTSDVGFENGGFTMIRRFTAVMNVIWVNYPQTPANGRGSAPEKKL